LLLAGGNQDAIRRLQLKPFVGLQNPSEPRLERVDAQRVGHILAGQFRNRHIRLLLGALCRHARQIVYGKAQRQADRYGFYVLSNEHVLVLHSD